MSHTDPPIELIARAYLRSGDRVLLCQNVKRGHQFLPGGHIDPGEPAAVALRREFMEEANLPVRVGPLLFVNESFFTEPNKSVHHEINLVFLVEPETPLGDDPPTSVESHIRFIWHDLNNPDAPTVLPAAIDDWLKSHPDPDGPPVWVGAERGLA